MSDLVNKKYFYVWLNFNSVVVFCVLRTQPLKILFSDAVLKTADTQTDFKISLTTFFCEHSGKLG